MFNFQNPYVERPSLCSNSESCTSDTIHTPGCPKLAADLKRIKANRDAYYADGGFHGVGK